MKCFNCGNILSDDAKFCSRCGEEQGFSKELTDRAMSGDESALTELYRRTYPFVYKTVSVLIKNEDVVLDILQDSYVKAFQNLGQLKEPDKFRAWVKRIAHNRAIDYLRKAKPVMFSQMSLEADETVEFADDRTDNLPEAVIDQKETARLMAEILDSLSPDQRAVIAMYYYEQHSVKHIADMLGVSENTVKSRLVYARKNIETAVKTLEKKGTKLYGLSPIPFLLLLFRNWDVQAKVLPHSNILSVVLEECRSLWDAAATGTAGTTGTAGAAGTTATTGTAGAAGTAGTTGTAGAAGAAGAAATKGFAVKLLAGILSVGILGGAAVGAVIYNTVIKPDTAPAAQVSEETPPEADTIEDRVSAYEAAAEKVDFNIRQEPSEPVIDPFIECFEGSDIPLPDTFFDIPAHNEMDNWPTEALFVFCGPPDPKDLEGGVEVTPPPSTTPVDAMECIEQLNEYLTGRGYGREPSFINKINGGTEFIWYKQDYTVDILMLAEDNFIFTAKKGSGFMPETLEGPWSGTEEAQDGYYRIELNFRSGGQVEYLIGPAGSEYMVHSIGTWSVDKDTLHMEFEKNELNGEAMDLDCTLRYKAVDATLELEYRSGDYLNIFQKENDIRYFERRTTGETYSTLQEIEPDDAASADGFFLTDEDKRYIREQLFVPESAVIEFEVGEPYFWEGVGMTLVPVALYENGTCVAGADVNVDTKEAMTSILTYQN